MTSHRSLLEKLYAAFNARDIEAVLLRLHDDVRWANGMSGGVVQGHAALREHWASQWRRTDSWITPLQFVELPDGRMAVEVHQLIRDLAGAILKDGKVRHLYRIEGGGVREMAIG
ncbi:MAG: nuclear transport factor 2 family protein [Reyranellaceae bacterium]